MGKKETKKNGLKWVQERLDWVGMDSSGLERVEMGFAGLCSVKNGFDCHQMDKNGLNWVGVG